jgi:hypothetical protein
MQIRNISSLSMVTLMACANSSEVSQGHGTSSTGSKATGGEGGGRAVRGAPSESSEADFSFFVTSLVAMQRLSGSQSGFGGDLRFGQADGLAGADEICRQIAEGSLPGAGDKTWRAFLSATKDASGSPVNAIDRVGSGPWYDRLGRLIALNPTDLAQTRPSGADPAILNDLPNEDGVPNHAPDGMAQVDNHDILTGSSATGTLYKSDWSVTCHDWTSAVGSDGKPRVGHSWPRSGGGFPTSAAGTGGSGAAFPGGAFGAGGSGGGRGPRGFPGGGMFPGGGSFGDMANWMSALDEAGCAPGVNVVEMGPPDPQNPTVGSGGGYGGIYCFALAE